MSELGLGSIVTFTGFIEHARVQDHFRQAQAFVFPSLREFGGAVVLEAMASGLPPIVVDYGGPGELVSDECGIRLPMAPREELVGRLSETRWPQCSATRNDLEKCPMRESTGSAADSFGRAKRPRSSRSIATFSVCLTLTRRTLPSVRHRRDIGRPPNLTTNFWTHLEYRRRIRFSRCRIPDVADGVVETRGYGSAVEVARFGRGGLRASSRRPARHQDE